MAPKYAPPTIEAIFEDPEDESRSELRSKEAGTEMVVRSRQLEHHEAEMAPARSSREKNKDKSRRSHKHISGSTTRRNSTKEKSNAPSVSSRSATSSRGEPLSGVRRSHRRARSGRGASSDSSSDDEDLDEDHRAILAAARGRLTSPSLISNMTTATNNSGGSSSSNSTITQASVSRELTVTRPEPELEAPISPAVPDPPDVFSFLEQDSPDEDEDDDLDDHIEETKEDPQWLSGAIYALPRLLTSPGRESMSSSGSSGSGSFHSDAGSEPVADNETDRSTSPERSVEGDDNSANLDPNQPTDPAASKLASQILAAQHRQSLHAAFQGSSSPKISRSNANRSHVSFNLSPTSSQHAHHRSVARTKTPPVTGYDALASKISSQGTKSSPIKPIYRKFERLNHRLLLHLQDELVELEDQLQMLDNVDTQSRSLYGVNASDIRILPASRRAAAHAGGELEWHKIDLINRIAFKLGQYNQALTSFNNLAGSMDVPHPDAVEHYRAYLRTEQPVMENETKFLEVSGDLVVVGKKSHNDTDRATKSHGKTDRNKKVHWESSLDMTLRFQIFAVAVAAGVLVPILTFAVIPGFLGRMTVVMLVAMGTVGALIQSGVAGRDLIGKELAACATIYGCVMVVIAAIFA